MTDALYVYAITARDSPMPAGLSGFEGRAVERARYRELAAVTSVVDPIDVQPTVEAVLIHESVVEALHASVALLPARFGTVFSDADAVIAALSSQYDALCADLERIGDKVEFGLTVLWDEAAGAEQGEYPDTVQVPGMDANPESDGPGTQYLRARVMELRLASEMRAKAEAISESLAAGLATVSLDFRKTILPTPRIAVRAAYLLHPSTVEAYHEAFERIRTAHPELRFLLNGPWPPYNFVSTMRPKGAAPSLGNLQTAGTEQQEEVAHGKGQG